MLGYDGSTPDDPVTLHGAAGEALELLRRPEEETPPTGDAPSEGGSPDLPPLPQLPAPPEEASSGEV